MIRLIVNADDFGLHQPLTKVSLKGTKRGLSQAHRYWPMAILLTKQLLWPRKILVWGLASTQPCGWS